MFYKNQLFVGLALAGTVSGIFADDATGTSKRRNIRQNAAACSRTATPAVVVSSGAPGAAVSATNVAATAPATGSATSIAAAAPASGTAPGTAAAATASGTASNTASAATASSTAVAGSRSFSPYIDATSLSDTQISALLNQSQVKDVTFAFIIAGSDNQPNWGGTGSPSSGYLKSQIASVPGTATISFGGAAGTYIDQVITNVPDVVTAYSSVIDAYNITHLDFDVEGAAVADTASVTRRNQALAQLRQKYPNLFISYTLAVMPTGLVSDGLNLLNDAKTNGFNPDEVRIMTMDYGASYSSDMGQYAIQAAQATSGQLSSIGFSKTPTIGVCPMIGQNDASNEVFSLADAQALATWASNTSYISTLTFWSLERDVASTTSGGAASSSSSGVVQAAFAFSKIFASAM